MDPLRSSTIRLAFSQPKDSPLRKTLLAALESSSEKTAYTQVVEGPDLIRRALRNGLLSREEARSRDVRRAAESAAHSVNESWPEGQGFGSSDMTFAIESMLRLAGFDTDWKGGFLVRVSHRRTAAVPSKLRSLLKAKVGKTAGFDPEEISALEPGGALESDLDEPYMGENFTEQETTELSDKVEGGALETDEMKYAALRGSLIRLAHEATELRPHILPLIKAADERAAADYLDRYKKDAVKAVRELFRQAEAGYGAGNAVGEVASVLRAAIPSNYLGFLPDALKKNRMAADFDPEEISALEPGGALESDLDEPYMGENFTEQETTELFDKQEGGKLETDEMKYAGRWEFRDYDEAFVEAVEKADMMKRPVELYKNPLTKTFSLRLFTRGDVVKGQIVKPGEPLSSKQKRIQQSKRAGYYLRKATIRMAFENPALRSRLLPLVKQAEIDMGVDRDTIDKAIVDFVKFAQKLVDDDRKKHGYDWKEELSINWGRRYAKIVKESHGQRSAYGFVDRDTGNILKAESWRRPARHARGNVLDKASWGRAATPYGMAYMRAAGDKQAWGEKLRGGTKKEYMEALRNAPHARKEHIEGGKRTMDVEHKDRGTTVARKTIIYKRDGRTVQSESYLINPNYLDGGDEAQRGW